MEWEWLQKKEVVQQVILVIVFLFFMLLLFIMMRPNRQLQDEMHVPFDPREPHTITITFVPAYRVEPERVEREPRRPVMVHIAPSELNASPPSVNARAA